MPFVKLDCGITDSTIFCEPNDVFKAWITLLVKAGPDGIARITAPALGLLCRVDTARAQQILTQFEAPDTDSRTQDAQGARILRVDGGYLILNYEKYRAKRDEGARREYMRGYMRNYRVNNVSTGKQDVNTSKPELAQAEAEADKKKNMGQQAGPSAEDLAFAEIQAAYPKREGSQRWKSARSSYRARIREGYTHKDIFAGVIRYSIYCETKKITRTGLVQQAATFLGTNLGFTEPWTMTDVVRRDDFKQLTDAEIVRRCRLAGIGTTGLSRQELISRLVA